MTEEQIQKVQRAKEIKAWMYDLEIELSTIARTLGYQGINVWDELDALQQIQGKDEES